MIIGCAQQAQNVELSKIILQSNQGNAIAQNNLGSRYQFGDGLPKDYTKAVELYEKSAAQGSLTAKVNLGYMYDQGLGININKKKAMALYQEAANEGYPGGMLNLSLSIKDNNINNYMWLEIARFYTQTTHKKRLKWLIRRSLDKLKKKMTYEEISQGNELAKNWIKNKIEK